MENLRILIQVSVDLLQFEFQIFGYTLSWWSIMIWCMIAYIVILVIVGFFK